MTHQRSRRDVLRASAASGVFVGVGGWGGLSSMATAAAPIDSPKREIEDDRIQRLAERIMQTSPDRIVEVVMTELRNGLSRQQLLAANFNAGARFAGAAPDQSSVIASTAASGEPSGRNMPYQVAVASIL